MLNRLTKEQSDRVAEFVEKWLKIGLCTEPANRQEAEKAIREAYRVAGKSQPEKIVWCGSPLSQGLTRTIILDEKLGDSVVGASVRSSVWASARSSVWASVGASVGASVWSSVRASVVASVGALVGDSVVASVRSSVWASVVASVGALVGDSVVASVWSSVRASVVASVGALVGDSVVASVRDSVWASAVASVGASVGDSVYGQHDAYWLAFYEYFREVCGLENQTAKLIPLIGVAKNAGWWLPHEKICWVSERHNILRRDERGRLHDVAGPALAYPDGWSIYAVHGVRVPSWIIEEKQLITPTKIDAETNAEIRRIMISFYGQSRYLLDSGAKEIHRDDWGILYRKELAGDEPLVMVKVVNSTPEPDGSMKDYFLRVDPNLRPLPCDQSASEADKQAWLQKQKPQKFTAKNAVASTFGLRGEEYVPQVQT